MIKIDVPIKPLSVNKAWQGRRYKTPDYLRYCRDVISLSDTQNTFTKEQLVDIFQKQLSIHYTFYVSSSLADWDNPIKPLQDIVFKQLNLNDKQIKHAVVDMVKVAKGQERSEIEIEIIN